MDRSHHSYGCSTRIASPTAAAAAAVTATAAAAAVAFANYSTKKNMAAGGVGNIRG
tara:strand:+ start:4579 stop:4746 length:168 start_codon:yes stop_codon:yes gene_type:complete